MNTLEFSRKSWHYQLISLFTDDFISDTTDICTYTKSFLKASLVALICLATYTLLACMVVDVLMAIGFWIFTGFWLINPIGMVFLITLGVVSIVAAIIGTIVFITDYLRERKMYRRDQPDGFIKHAVKSHLGKYCVKIEMKDE